MKRVKRIISLAACAAIMLTTMAASVFAEDAAPEVITYPAADIQTIENPEQNPFVILIAGEVAELESYSVEGSTYVRLSDMASALGIELAVSSSDAMLTATAIELETKTEDGINYYSTDGGETWNELEAGEFSLLEDGVVEGVEGFSVSAITSPVGSGFSVSDTILTATAIELETKTEDGINYYSTDGGETWNELEAGEFSLLEDGVVEGVEGFSVSAITSPVGSGFSVSDTILTATAIELETKTEDGINYYSTDGGETWNELEAGIINLQESGRVGFFTASSQMRQYLINGEVFSNLRDLGRVLGYEVVFENDTILITK